MMTKRELLTLVTQFTEALVHNRPQDVPTTADCKCTYEGIQSPLGSGEVWGVPRRIPYRQTFVDRETSTACFCGVVTNHIASSVLPADQAYTVHGPQKWWIYFLRITASEKGICEVEEIARPETAALLTVVPAQMKPERILECPIAEEDRSSREEMIRIAALYWDGVNKLIDPALVPIHPDARRFEVGTPVTDELNFPDSVRTCYDKADFSWQVIKRRYPVVDVNAGIVVSTVHMLADDPTMPTGYVTDVFKMECGMIKYIYAFHDWQIQRVDWDGVGPQTSAECI
jgi:hypothetical protein